MFNNAITQIAYVCEPDAFDAAIDHWQHAVGAGPFWSSRVQIDDQVYRGRPTAGIIDVALGFVGPLQIELISPVNNADSPWTAWRKDGLDVPRAGLFHHFLIDTDDYDGALEDLLAIGCCVELSGTIFGDRRLAYLDGGSAFGHRIEVIQRTRLGDTFKRLMRERSQNWDGANPRRSYRELFEDAKAEAQG